MKLSLSWLKEFVDWNGTAGDLALRLTDAGLPVESIGGRREDLAPIVVGEVLEARRHPNADRLTLCRVDVGGGETLSIVCGAPNVRTGQRVAVGRVGTTLPNGLTLEARKIRGETSQGMICSGEELACDPTPDGIWVLPEASDVGASLRAALGWDDDVLEIEVPSNRGDALSHIGVAREVAALTGAPVRLPAAYSAGVDGSARDAGGVPITIEDPAGCPVYGAVRLRGVRVGPPPEWLRRRVESLGIRSLSNVVDATNLVLLESGHPVHAFDLARLAGPEIRVRRARPGEGFFTLDGKECKPTAEVLVIADRDRPAALAGIMGGRDSEVSDSTSDLLIEVALFDPYVVRAGSRIVKKTSEASLRFGRGVDPEGIGGTLARVTELIIQVSGGERVGGACVVRAAETPARRIAYDPALAGRLLGAPVTDQESEEILRRLSCRVEKGPAGAAPAWSVEPPSYRRDLSEPVDLVEEIARVRGYDAIPERAAATVRGASRDPVEARERRVRSYLADAGFFEARTLTLLDPDEIARLRLGAVEAPLWTNRKGSGELAVVENPLASDQSALRPSLLVGLLGALRLNRNRGVADVRLFEIGPVFRRSGDGPKWGVEERRSLALAWCGAARPAAWDDPGRGADFFDLKGVLLAAADAIGAPALRAGPPVSAHPLCHPGRQASLLLGETRVGVIGELESAVADAAGLPERALVAEIDFDALTELPAPIPFHRALPRYPSIRRDVALLVPDELAEERVREVLVRAAGERLESAALFDLYRGAPIPEGKKSFAYAFVFRSPDATLTDAEADRLRDAIAAAASTELGAQVR